MALKALVGQILDSAAGKFKPGKISLEAGRIKAIEWGNLSPEQGEETLYRPEGFIAPGFIEMQLNGGLGFDFTAQPEKARELSLALPRWGVTSFLPTVITSPEETYLKALNVIGDLMGQAEGAQILGVHLEGPFINQKYRGAHNPLWLRTASLEKIQPIVEAGSLRLLTLAPELPGAIEVISFLSKKGVVVSMGHSAATFEEALAGIEAGASYATHLFNAMPPLHHRQPGLVGAALTSPNITPGVIPDGIHLDPSLLKIIFAAKGSRRLNLVTDAMAGMGMAPGQYQLSGETVIVDGTSARLDNQEKTLAGSILTLDQGVRNMVEWQICSFEEAIEMVTVNPACLLGLSEKGRLEAGKDADIVILNPALQVETTLVKGEIVFKAKNKN